MDSEQRRTNRLIFILIAMLGFAVALSNMLMMLSGCEDPPLSGTVEHRSYSAPYEYYTYPCVLYGSNGLCRVYGLQLNRMPATWQLCVRGPNKNGKVVSDCMYVAPTDFDRYRVGDQWPR